MYIINTAVHNDRERQQARLREARIAYEDHEVTCECDLCELYLDELADIAAHGPLDESFDPADGSYIPEDDHGYQP